MAFWLPALIVIGILGTGFTLWQTKEASEAVGQNIVSLTILGIILTVLVVVLYLILRRK